MINHIVILKIATDINDTEIQKVFNALAKLVDVIPGLMSFSGGENNSPECINRGYSHAFHMTFKDANARDAYLPHPEHERVKKMIGNILDKGDDPVLVIDY
jgi:hypothetical protein